MANKYTQQVNTPYVNTYAPINMDQMGNLMRDASAYRASTAESDARTEALGQSVAANDPEGQEYLKAIEQIQKDNIASRGDESLAQRAIRAKTAGIRTAGAVQQLKNAKEQVSTWQQEMLDMNPDMNQDELMYRIQRNKPALEYDAENLRVNADVPSARQFAPDVNLPEKAQDYLGAIHEGTLPLGEDGKQLVEKVIDPQTGQVTYTTAKGIPPMKINRALGMAFAGDQEAQDYISRKGDYYAMKMEDEGSAEDYLEDLVESTPEGRRPKVLQDINTYRQSGLSNSEIAGNILAQQELKNAIGFGVEAGSYSLFDQKTSNIDSDLIQKGINKGFLPTEVLANPEIAELDSEVSLPGLVDSGTFDEKDLNYYRMASSHSFSRPKQPAVVEQGINSMDLDTLLTSNEANTRYGKGVLEDLHKSIGGKPDDMSNTRYIEEYINPAYQKKIEGLGNYVTYVGDMSAEEREEMSDKIIGRKGANGDLGQFTSSMIKVHTDKGSSDFLSLGEVADKYDIDLSSMEGRKELQERMNLIGRRTDGTSYITRVYDDAGMFGPNNKEVQIEIANPVFGDSNKQAADLLEIQTALVNQEKTFDIMGEKVDVQTKDYYYDPDTGQQVPPNDPKARYKRVLEFTQPSTGMTYNSIDHPERVLALENKINKINGQER